MWPKMQFAAGSRGTEGPKLSQAPPVPVPESPVGSEPWEALGAHLPLSSSPEVSAAQALMVSPLSTRSSHPHTVPGFVTPALPDFSPQPSRAELTPSASSIPACAGSDPRLPPLPPRGGGSVPQRSPWATLPQGKRCHFCCPSSQKLQGVPCSSPLAFPLVGIPAVLPDYAHTQHT